MPFKMGAREITQTNEGPMSSSRTHAATFVPETAFGVWFLRTHTWEHHVLRVAIDDLKRLVTAPLPTAPVILDLYHGSRSIPEGRRHSTRQPRPD